MIVCLITYIQGDMRKIIPKNHETLKRNSIIVSILLFGVIFFSAPLISMSPSSLDETFDTVKQTVKVTAEELMQLFDIKMELENAVLKDSSDLRANISFESFGNVPTPVNMMFKVLDEHGDAVYSEHHSITVETENVYVKDFPKLVLPAGKYSLMLSTNYNGDVNDDFRQEFEVQAAGIFARYGSMSIIVVSLAMGAIALFLIYRFWGADWF